MYNWQFDGFMWMNVLPMYLGFGEMLEYQADIMRLFRQYGAFDGRKKDLSFFERNMLEQIANEEGMGKQPAKIANSPEKR